MLGVVRWIEIERVYPGGSWRLWLLHELLDVAAREPGFTPAGEATVRQVSPLEFAYAEKLRPDRPAMLVLAEIPTASAGRV
jgi:hypothetical protein